MSETIEFKSRVGENGLLNLNIRLGEMGAGTDVIVTIRRVRDQPQLNVIDAIEWHRLADETYGSCAGLGLERAPQGEFEIREDLE